MSARSPSLLQELAALSGLLVEYEDFESVRREASDDALLAALRALGIAIDGPDDAARALDAERRRVWGRLVEPCAVSWDGSPVSLLLRVGSRERGSYAVTVRLESGELKETRGRLSSLPVRRWAEVDGKRVLCRELRLPAGLEPGYHRAEIRVGKRVGECLVIASPTRAWGAPGTRPRTWGVFAPTYALRSRAGSGAGDLGDLEAMGRWVSELGGSVIGTLPLLSSFLDEPFESSPYSPVSKLFWNGLYARVEPDGSDAKELAALRDAPLVDYRAQMARKRVALEREAERAWNEQRPELEAFLTERPRVDDYARFRAAVERHRGIFRDWPARQRDGELRSGDYDEGVWRYHVHAQYLMNRQLAQLGRSSGAELYLDLPVGVNRYGYDAWRERDLFVLDASAGAPPDALFGGGQNWGFPPVHPERLRESGYRYLIDSARAHFEHATMLRIDHGMGLHRLYWIPEGMPATEGVYVRYRPEEQYAVFVLESHRHQCSLAGEDLGTVPEYVPPAMRRHGLHRLFVVQFALPGESGESMQPVPAEAVASLNTHDTPTFASFWHGGEIDVRAELGLLDEEQARAEWQARKALECATISWLEERGRLPSEPPAGNGEPEAGQGEDGEPEAGQGEDGEPEVDDALVFSVMRACLEELAASDAQMVLVTLEDLWLEREPQNVPGTGWERPNWRRKLRRTLEEAMEDPEIRRALERIDELRCARNGS